MIKSRYGYDAETGLTYGIFNNHSWAPIYAEDKSTPHTRHSPTNLALTLLKFPDEAPWGVAGFELEVPNGEYYVTVGGGNPGWDSLLRMYVEGQVYSGMVNSDNLYILDIAPEVPGETPLTWRLISNLAENAPITQYGYIRTLGGNNLNPEYWSHAEILYLDKQIVNVTDGRLTIHGASLSSEPAYYLNFVEVAPVPPLLTCEDVWSKSLGLPADLNKDCYVDFKDFVLMAEQWLQ